MPPESYLFDTYAIVEILKDNPHYRPYLEKGMVINDFIFSEVAYKLLQLLPPGKANEALADLFPSSLRPSAHSIIKGARLRISRKKANLSITDCISYSMAKEIGIPFLTGDEQFRGMEHVEFVK